MSAKPFKAEVQHNGAKRFVETRSKLRKVWLTSIQGFYFAVSGEVKWIDAAKAINKIGVHQGWLPADSKPVSWTEAQVASLLPEIPIPGIALYLWGSNSRADSVRARSLGWEPRGPSFWDLLEEDVSIAVAKLKK